MIEILLHGHQRCGTEIVWNLVEAKASSAVPKKRAANPDEADTAWQPSGELA